MIPYPLTRPNRLHLARAFAAIAGLFLSAQTLSGDVITGAAFTLQSIAVVVLGGTSLFGGKAW
jgi:ribose transport system permease protein